jgi:lupus La protein
VRPSPSRVELIDQKGFGEEVKENQETQTKILQYFEQFGEINAVRLRREDKAGVAGKGRGAFKVC